MTIWQEWCRQKMQQKHTPKFMFVLTIANAVRGGGGGGGGGVAHSIVHLGADAKL